MGEYGWQHQQIRRYFERQVLAGGVRCGRGAECFRAEGGFGGFIIPGEDWDLGHDDYDRSRYTGPEHRACNRATAGRRLKTSRKW